MKEEEMKENVECGMEQVLWRYKAGEVCGESA